MAQTPPDLPNVPAVAFIAQGRLFLYRPGEARPREVDSYFADQLRQRQQRQQTAAGWQASNPVWGSMQMPAAWYGLGQTAAIADQTRAVFGDVSACGPDQAMLYVLHTDTLSGLFEYSPAVDEERRLIHQQGMFLRNPQRHRLSGRLVCCVEMEDGTAHLAVGDDDGRRRRLITEGDSRDESPSWVRGEGPARIVYQSAGVGRDQYGTFFGLGPYRVELLDLDQGEVRTLLESSAHDYLAPQLDADGTLYVIERPYEPGGGQSWVQTVKAALLFPWHVILTLVMLFNFLSMIFRGKPAVDAPATPHRPNPTAVVLWGRVLQAKRSAKRGRSAPTPLAPPQWRLLAVSPDGAQQVIAERVICFDLADGGVVYSDGCSVRFRDHAGDTTELCEGDLIEKLTALDD